MKLFYKKNIHKYKELCRAYTQKALMFALEFSVKANLPWVSALLLVLSVQRLHKKRDGKNILYIGSVASFVDIGALVKYSGNCGYSYLNRKALGIILLQFSQSQQINDHNYYQDESFLPCIEKTHSYIQKLFPVFRFFHSFDAVMTSNFSYHNQQEFVRVTRSLNIPVIILFKEGLLSPVTLNDMCGMYKTRKIQCDLFLCSNQYIKKTFLQHNLNGLENENIIKVVGPPRLDFYTKNFTEENNNSIVLFDFSVELKFGPSYQSLARLLLTRHVEIYRYAIQYALDNPARRVIIKTKSPIRHLHNIMSLIKDELGYNDIPANIIITNNGDARELITEAGYVLGFQSTTLVEALLAGRPVATIDMGEEFPTDLDIFGQHHDLITYIKNQQDFNRFVTQVNSFDALPKDRVNDFIESYFSICDGEKSQRTEKYITELI